MFEYAEANVWVASQMMSNFYTTHGSDPAEWDANETSEHNLLDGHWEIQSAAYWRADDRLLECKLML